MEKTTKYASIVLKIILLIAGLAFINASLQGCSRSVGGLDNQNNNQTTEGVTRAQVVMDMVVLMGYDIWSGPCTSLYPDVLPNSDVCRAINVLEMRDMELVSYPDGTFRPDYQLPRAEVWALTNRIMGFVPYHPMVDVTADVPFDQWYAPHAKTLEIRGLLILDQDDMAYPAEVMPLELWNQQLLLLDEYLDGNTSVRDAAELIFAILLRDIPVASNGCTSPFTGVENNSLECHLAVALLEEGLLDEANHFELGSRTLTWGELFKLFTLAKNLPPSDTGSAGISPTYWDEPYWNTVGDLGLLEGYMVHGETMPLRASHQFAWDLSILLNTLP